MLAPEHKEMLTPAEIDTLELFLSAMKKVAHVKRLYLYGSRSTGRANVASDMDVAVLVNRREEIKETNHIIEHWIETNDFIEGFHPIVVDEEMLANTFFGKNVKEGKLLWAR